MRCLRLAHINVRVERLEDAVKFYQDVLGLEPILRGGERGRGAWFRLGEAEVHLSEDAVPQPPSRRHFAVEVESLADARREIAAAGRPIEGEEARRFWTRDPAGNRIEIVQCASAR